MIMTNEERLLGYAYCYYAFRGLIHPDFSDIDGKANEFLIYCRFLAAMTCLYGDLEGCRTERALAEWHAEIYPPPSDEDLASWAEDDDC